ncbi:MAG: hypothetical protein ACOY3I_02630 [Verrucomicrobiota bacterium]
MPVSTFSSDESILSEQIDVHERTRRLSFFLDITVVINVILALGVFGVSIAVLVKFSEPPMVVQQDYGYLQHHPTKLFKLTTPNVRAFVNRVMGNLLHYSPDGYDRSYLAPFVHSKVLYNFSREVVRRVEIAQKFNIRQLWRLQDMRRVYDSDWPSTIVLSVRGEKVVYSDDPQDELVTTHLEKSMTFYRLYIVQQPQTVENPWGLFLVTVVAEKGEAEFLKVWKTGDDPDDNNPEFSWSPDWTPPRRKQIHVDAESE